MLIKYINYNDISAKYTYVKTEISNIIHTHGLELIDNKGVFTIYTPKTKLNDRISICMFQLTNKTFKNGDMIIYPYDIENKNLIINTIIPKFDSIKDLVITITPLQFNKNKGE